MALAVFAAESVRNGSMERLVERHIRNRLHDATRRGALVDRRAFLGSLAGAVLAAAPGAEAQQPKKLYRIGMIERTSTVINAVNVNSFRQGLREFGYVEGESFVIEYRSADGRDERFPGLATELVRLKVDLILTRGTPAALAAQNATGTIPVVIVGVGDPVGQGVVASLRTPGQEYHRAERRSNGDLPETGPAAQRAGSASRTNRGPLQYE